MPAPAQQLTTSKAAIAKAEEAMRDVEVPQAKLYLSMARDHISTAEQLIAREEMEEANLVLIQAEMDAELAASLAREADLEEQAADARNKISKLQKEAQEGAQ